MQAEAWEAAANQLCSVSCCAEMHALSSSFRAEAGECREAVVGLCITSTKHGGRFGDLSCNRQRLGDAVKSCSFQEAASLTLVVYFLGGNEGLISTKSTLLAGVGSEQGKL